MPGKVTGIRWTSDGDECEARIGGPVKWAKRDRRTGRLGTPRTEGTVVRIDHGACWEVWLDPVTHHPPRVWNNPIYCGERVELLREGDTDFRPASDHSS